MAEERRQESQGWFERQRASLLQRSESRQAGTESTSAGGRSAKAFLLRAHGRDEKEAHFLQNREGPK